MNSQDFINWVIDKGTFTIQEMADGIDIGRNNFYRWKEGKSIPKKSTINKLVDYIGYDIKWNNDDIEIIGETSEVNLQGDEKLGIQADTIIQNQQQLINSLNKEVNILRKQKTLKVNPACDFKIEVLFNVNDKSTPDEVFDNMQLIKIDSTVSGDCSMLGYSIKELEKMNLAEFIDLHHPETRNDAESTKNIIRDTLNDLVHIRGIRTLMAKSGKWKNFLCEYYFQRDVDDKWSMVCYFQHLNGGLS